MRKYLLSTTLVFVGSSAFAQETTDSIKTQELNEVVVEARTQRVIERGMEYIPSKRTKKAAIDVTQLLELMNVPQLDITPGSMSVKTYAGKDVGMFIDYKEATIEDLQGLGS